MILFNDEVEPGEPGGVVKKSGIRFNPEPEPVEKPIGMFGGLKEPAIDFAKEVGSGLIEGTDAAATLAHGASMFLPGLLDETMAIGRGIIDPNMTIREARDRSQETMMKGTLQPGDITRVTKEFFNIGQDPGVPIGMMKKVSHGFETMIPTEQIEHGIAQGKGFNIPGVSDEAWDVAGFGMSKFIELLAFKGFHEIGVKGVKEVKSKIKGIEKRGKFSEKELDDLAKRVDDIDLSGIGDKATGERIVSELKWEIVKKKKLGVFKELDKASEKQQRLTDKRIKDFKEKYPEEEIPRDIQVDKDPYVEGEKVNEKLEIFRKLDKSNERRLQKISGEKEIIQKEKLEREILTGKAVPDLQYPEIIKKPRTPFSKMDKIRRDIQLKKDAKAAEPIVEERSIFQDELDKIKVEEKIPFDDLITKGEIGYHGTSTKFMQGIKEKGLRPISLKQIVENVLDELKLKGNERDVVRNKIKEYDYFEGSVKGGKDYRPFEQPDLYIAKDLKTAREYAEWAGEAYDNALIAAGAYNKVGEPLNIKVPDTVAKKAKALYEKNRLEKPTVLEVKIPGKLKKGDNIYNEPLEYKILEGEDVKAKVEPPFDDLITKGEDVPIFKDSFDANLGGLKTKRGIFKTKASAEKKISKMKGDLKVIKINEKYRIAEKSNILEDNLKDKMTPDRERLLQELSNEYNKPFLKDVTYKYLKEPEQFVKEIDAYGETMRKWVEKPGDDKIILSVEKELRKIGNEIPSDNPKYEIANDYIDRMLTGIDHIKVERGIGDRANVLIDAKKALAEKLKEPEVLEEPKLEDIFERDPIEGVGREVESIKEIFNLLNDERGSFSTKDLSPEKVQQLKSILQKAKEEGLEVFKYLIGEGFSEKEAMIVDEFIKMRAQVELPKFKAKDFKNKAIKIKQAKRTAVRMEIDKRLADATPKEKLSEFHQYLLDLGIIVKGYKKGSYKLPQHMKTGISTNRIPKIKSNDFGETFESPHYQFKKVFDIMDNPSIDMQHSNMAFFTNVKNSMKWKKDLFKNYNKDIKVREKRIREVLEPVYEKYRPMLRARDSLKNRINVVKSQLKKSPKKEKAIYEQRLEDLKIKLKETSEKFKDLPMDYDKVIPQLYDDPVVKATLHAGKQLPEGIKLNADEMFLSERLQEYFLTKGEHLKDVGISIESSKKPYMTRLWQDVVDSSSSDRMFKKLLKKFKSPEVLNFQRQMPDGRIWIPDASQILEMYIPLVEKKLAHQPFFNRFAETMGGADIPLSNFYNKWIEKNLYRKAEVGLAKMMEQGVDTLINLEYIRLIGFSLSVGFKHLLKLPGTFSTYNGKTNLQASKLALKATGQALKKTLGREPKGHELDVIDAFLKQKNIVAELDQMPGLKEGSQRVKTLIAQPTVAIEAFENGVNVMAGIISGTGKMPLGKVRRAIMQNILETNFRGGADQFLWMKSTPARVATMFMMTPTKLLEFKYNLVKGALKGEKDVFGTSYRTRFIRYLMYIGFSESIARANDTSILELFLHFPFISHFIEPTESGYKFHVPDIYMSPLIDLYTDLSNRGLFGNDKSNPWSKHFEYMGTASKLMNLKNKDYPTDYYDSWAKQMIGLPAIKKSTGRPRKGGSGGIGGGFSSGLGGGL